MVDQLIKRFSGLFNGSEFYNNEYGLRCLLNAGEMNTYFLVKTIIKADKIISSLLDQNDLYFVLSYFLLDRKQIKRIMKDHIDLLGSIHYELIEMKSTEINQEDDCDSKLRVDFLYKGKGSAELIYKLIWLPIVSDFGLIARKKYYYQLHIANFDQSIVMHPYDDRGIDILCKDLATYRETYKKLEPYLLEHDIELMKKRLQ